VVGVRDRDIALALVVPVTQCKPECSLCKAQLLRSDLTYLIPDLQNKAPALVEVTLDLVRVFSSQGVPAAPNRPIAQERSCTSVILRWLPPSSTGNCTISGYTVEYREEGKWFEPCWLAGRMRTK